MRWDGQYRSKRSHHRKCPAFWYLLFIKRNSCRRRANENHWNPIVHSGVKRLDKAESIVIYGQRANHIHSICCWAKLDAVADTLNVAGDVLGSQWEWRICTYGLIESLRCRTCTFRDNRNLHSSFAGPIPDNGEALSLVVRRQKLWDCSAWKISWNL